MATNKSNLVITILVLVIVVLAAVVLYTLVVKPKLSGYVVEKQTEGVQIAVNSILLQLQQNGYVQIPAGLSEDGQQQVINLITPQQCSAFQELSAQAAQ